MLTVESAHTPVYATPDKSCISLMVKFAEFNEELPFGATPHDPHEHGRNLYERAIAEEFGEIGEYVGATNPAQDQPSTQGTQNL
jgi:hypothetical protein